MILTRFLRLRSFCQEIFGEHVNGVSSIRPKQARTPHTRLILRERSTILSILSFRTPAYDLNGNTTANGTGQIYDSDAENRLIKITYADNSSTWFIYDGLSRRVRITERNAASAITSDKRYLWAGGNQPAEERDAA